MTRTIESESTNRIDRKRAKIVFVASFVATVLSEEQDLLCEDRRHDVISNGLPQGSLLGPILFILYTEFLQKIANYGLDIQLYVDDSHLYIGFSASKPSELADIKESDSVLRRSSHGS